MTVRLDSEDDLNWTRGEDNPVETEEKAWVPYVGPQGGEGWQDTSTGDVIYDDEPPGEAAGEGLDDASEEELLDAVEEVFDEESAESLEGLSAEEIRLAIQSEAAPSELEDLGNALDSDEESGNVPAGPTTAEDLSEGDEVKIEGKDATVTRKSDMGGGYYIAGETEDGEVVTARVGPSQEFEPADRGDDEPGGVTTPGGDMSEGDIVMMEGEASEVTQVTDMGGGYFISAVGEETGDVHTARVGPDEEFELPGEEPGPEGFDVIYGEDIEAADLDAVAREGGVAVYDGDAYQVTDVDFADGVITTESGEELDIIKSGGGMDPGLSAISTDADIEDIGAGASELGFNTGDDVLIEGETEDGVTVAEVDPFGCEAGETELTDTNGQSYCVVGEDLSEPATGPDPTDNEPGDYDVEENTFGWDLAEAVSNGEMLGTDAIYRNMGKVDDPELVAHALMLELQGKNRKTARERLESKLGIFDEGPTAEDVRAWVRGESPGGDDGGIDFEDASKEELLAGLQKVVDRNMMAQDVMDTVADSSMSADTIRENVEEYLSPGKRAALEDVLQEGVEVDDGGDDTGYDSPFETPRLDLRDAMNNPSDLIGAKGGFNSRGMRNGYNIERLRYLAENVDTEDLETAYETEYDGRKRAIGGLLHHRADSDIRADDALTTSFDRSAMDRDEWADNLNEGLDMIDPAVTALTLSNINRAGTDSLSGNTLGVWKPSSSTMWTDNEGRYTDVATTKHETMHALHYAVGVKASTRVDNSNERNPDNWTFGVSSNGDTDFSDEFADRVRKQIGVWEERAKTHGAHQTECRSYQRTNANEFMAVTYAHWQDDRAKLESKHPEAAAMWDDMLGKRDVNTKQVELEEGRYGMKVPDAIEEGDRVNVIVDGVSVGHQGEEREEFTNAEVTYNGGEEVDLKLGPEGHTVPVDKIESIEMRAVGREPGAANKPDIEWSGDQVRRMGSPERALEDRELNVETESGMEFNGMRVQEVTDQTLWLRDPTKTGPASETNVPLDDIRNIEAFDL